MDIGGVNRPAVTSSQATFQRVDPPASSGFSRTQLSRDAAVQPVEKIAAVRFEPSDGANQRAALDAMMQRAVERTTGVDDRTKNVVFKTIDEGTGEVMMQLPSEQALKLRAYLRESTATIEKAAEANTPRDVIA